MSGDEASPANPAWFMAIRDQCAEAGVAYFHKQNGEWAVRNSDQHRDKEHIFLTKDWDYVRVGKKVAGRLLDGHEHNEFPRLAA
jgi:protein gp37